jgi:hypothetical protein
MKLGAAAFSENGVAGANGSAQFKLEEHPAVYDVLADHQKNEEWRYNALASEAHRWASIFNDEFQLEVPEVSLAFENLRRTRFGHFRYGHNGFGLKGEIAINAQHILNREFWQTLGTLLHELLHAWQQAHGKPGKRNHHNKEFRARARGLGLIVDQRGHTSYEPNSAFTTLLKKHGVHVPPLVAPTSTKAVRGESKLKKWSCGCTNVRVAISDFRARCLKCNGVFEAVTVLSAASDGRE